MGSFNIKCFASGQVIAEGEKCRVAVILQSATYSPALISYSDQAYELYGVRHASYGPGSLWRPRTGFLSGTYDDCFKILLDETPENLAILAEFFTGFYRHGAVSNPKDATRRRRGLTFDFKLLVEENAPQLHGALSKLEKYYDCLTPESLVFSEVQAVWELLQESIMEEVVFCADGSQVLRPLQLAAVHEVTFQGLIALAEGLKSYDGSPFAREPYFTRAFQGLNDVVADVDDVVKPFFRMDAFRESLRLRMDSELTHATLWAFHKSFERTVGLVAEKGEPVARFLEDCKAPLDSLYALKGLERLDVPFTPLADAGQDYDNATGKQYAEFVNSVSVAICAEKAANAE